MLGKRIASVLAVTGLGCAMMFGVVHPAFAESAVTGNKAESVEATEGNGDLSAREVPDFTYNVTIVSAVDGQTSQTSFTYEDITSNLQLGASGAILEYIKKAAPVIPGMEVVGIGTDGPSYSYSNAYWNKFSELVKDGSSGSITVYALYAKDGKVPVRLHNALTGTVQEFDVVLGDGAVDLPMQAVDKRVPVSYENGYAYNAVSYDMAGTQKLPMYEFGLEDFVNFAVKNPGKTAELYVQYSHGDGTALTAEEQAAITNMYQNPDGNKGDNEEIPKVPVPTVEGDAGVTASGTLSGANIPAGAQVALSASRVDHGDGWDALNAKAHLGTFLGEGSFVGVYDVSLTVNGTQVHDGFGTLVLRFPVGEAYNGQQATVWHLHQDGSITNTQVEVVDGAVTVSVKDLSTFAVTIAPKDAQNPPATTVKDNATNQDAKGKGDSKQGLPQTGDDTSAFIALCGIAGLAALAGAATIRRQQ